MNLRDQSLHRRLPVMQGLGHGKKAIQGSQQFILQSERWERYAECADLGLVYGCEVTGAFSAHEEVVAAKGTSCRSCQPLWTKTRLVGPNSEYVILVDVSLTNVSPYGASAELVEVATLSHQYITIVKLISR